jgi:hypothetical protein
MKTTMLTKGGAPRTSTIWALACLFLTVLGLNAAAGGGGQSSGTGVPPTPTELSPVGEEGSSMPIVRDTHGLTFVGPMRELRTLALHLRGNGQIDVQRLGRGRVAVTLIGDFRVDLDRAALVRSSVEVLFAGGAAFQDGVALLQIGGSTPVMMDAERVPLPVSRLASSRRAMGRLLGLDVVAPGRTAHVAASFALDRVTMTQRIR